MKEEALWLLRKNSPRGTFEEDIKNFGTRLNARGNPDGLVGKILSEVHFADRKAALTQKGNPRIRKFYPIVSQFQSSLPCLKNILMGKWHLIQNQPLLREMNKENLP